MNVKRWRFSLRQLLILMAVVAVVVALVSHQWSLVVGLATAAVGFLDAVSPAINTFLKAGSLDELGGGRQPTEKEAQEFAALYPKRPGVASKSVAPTDSK